MTFSPLKAFQGEVVEHSGNTGTVSETWSVFSIVVLSERDSQVVGDDNPEGPPNKWNMIINDVNASFFQKSINWRTTTHVFLGIHHQPVTTPPSTSCWARREWNQRCGPVSTSTRKTRKQFPLGRQSHGWLENPLWMEVLMRKSLIDGPFISHIVVDNIWSELSFHVVFTHSIPKISYYLSMILHIYMSCPINHHCYVRCSSFESQSARWL